MPCREDFIARYVPSSRAQILDRADRGDDFLLGDAIQCKTEDEGRHLARGRFVLQIGGCRRKPFELFPIGCDSRDLRLRTLFSSSRHLLGSVGSWPTFCTRATISLSRLVKAFGSMTYRGTECLRDIDFDWFVWAWNLFLDFRRQYPYNARLKAAVC
jgi:hypothetical protein